MMKLNIFLTLILMAVFGAKADSFTYSGLTFDSTSDSECTITGPVDLNVTDLVIPAVAYDGAARYDVTAIAASAFEENCNIHSVAIPPSVAMIGADAFHNCHYLTGINITDLEAWCRIRFENEFANPLRGLHDLTLNGQPLRDLVVPETITAILPYAFYDCRSLRSVTLHDGVVSIGMEAFNGCEYITTLDLGSGLRTVGDFAFNINSSLTAVRLPDSLRTLGTGVFYGCFSLTDITGIPQITEIPALAFAGCTSLTSCILSPTVNSIGEYAFYYCPVLTDITLPEGLRSVYGHAFDSCTSLRELRFPEGVEFFGAYVCNGCTSLKDTNLPPTMKAVPEGMFCNCTALGEFPIPEGVTEIADYAFAGCRSLRYIALPHGLTAIGTRSFYGCAGLHDVEFGENMQTIGTESFYYCSALKEISCRAVTPPTLSFFGFDTTHDRNAMVYVPEISLPQYRVAFAWRTFAHLEGKASLNSDTTVAVDMGAGGSITHFVAYGRTLTLTLIDADGRLPTQILYNGVDRTDAITAEGDFTTPPVTAPATLTVRW